MEIFIEGLFLVLGESATDGPAGHHERGWVEPSDVHLLVGNSLSVGEETEYSGEKITPTCVIMQCLCCQQLGMNHLHCVEDAIDFIPFEYVDNRVTACAVKAKCEGIPYG